MAFKKVAVHLTKFGHDSNGNPIARHTVYGYNNLDQDLEVPSKALYQTRIRPQVGYSPNRDEAANTVLAKAGISNAQFLSCKGDRASGEIWLIYQVPG